MTKKAIIFDFDGTLADTLPICVHAASEAFLKYDGRALTAPEVIAMFGPTEADIIRLNLANREQAEAGVRLFLDIYEREHEVRVRPNDAISEMLETLKEKGYRMGIVTGKGRETLDISLDRLGIGGYFDVTVTGDDTLRPKPDPEGVLTAMRALDAQASETVFVGDSEADMGAGLAAGVFTVGAHWLEHVQTPHFQAKPDLYVTKTEQLLDYLEQYA